jgi:hypothetical protein
LCNLEKMATSIEHGIGAMQQTENDMMSTLGELFRKTSHETTMLDGRTNILRPIDKTNEGPFSFKIPAQGAQYLQLAATRLYMVLRLVNRDGTDLEANAKVAPVNMIGSSLFKSIDVEVNGVPIPHLSNMYSNYKAYLETVLTYGKEAVDGHLACSRVEMDTEGHFDNASITNVGWETRRKIAALSKKFEVMIPVHCDLMQCDKLLLPGFELTIKFTRADDAFTVHSPDRDKAYRIVIDDIRLHIRHLTMTDEILHKHMTALDHSDATYSLNRTVMKIFPGPAYDTTILIPSLFSGTFPKQILVGMMTSENLNGTQGTNPYHFQHFNLCYAALNVNGIYVPQEPYTPDFDTHMVVREYREFCDNVGIGDKNMANLVTPKLWKGGCFLLAFDLTPDHCFGHHSHMKSSGNMSLSLKFKDPLAKPTTVFAFAVYDNEITIDKHNNIKSDAVGV